VDADAFFFLHDLITSYLKEKEKVLTSQLARSGSPSLSTAAGSTNQAEQIQMETSTTHIGASSLSMMSDTISVSSAQHLSAGGSNKNLTNLSGASSSSNINSAEELRHVVGNKKIATSKATSSSGSGNKGEVETSLRIDWRTFDCKTWHLEPTIR
jgi:Fragile site-associated protein C-terminus